MTFTTPTKTLFTRKTLLTAAGLAFAGASIAGPTSAALAADPTPAGKPAAAVQHLSPDTPDTSTLTPHGVQGAQSHLDLTAEKTGNAKAIIAAVKKAGLDERAAVISIATSLQESKLDNLGHLGDANDHDSLGLFQQRPTSGWGTPDQITNPEHATTAFLNGLRQVDGWHDMPLTDAAQKVQVSAYPDAYAQWESQAADLVHNLWTH
jgi:hypothetical protein